MNKKDFIVIGIILFLSIAGVIFLNLTANSNDLMAKVYYENDLLIEIDLSINDTYIVEGKLGEVVIEVKDNKIAVIKETSPNHICSKQGFVSSSLTPIICLPNKIIINLVSNETNLDAVVR